MDRKARSRLWVGLLCFFLPAVIFLTICAAMGFAPFGDSSILIFDLSDQYVEFLCALKHGDVFFSWNTALGGSYIGTFSYYVSSPFSLLSLLCPDEKMPIAVVFIIALKLACAGFTFSLLLRRRTGRYDLTTAAFALCYALMSYNMAYAMSFMWLDGVLWLPVLLIGVEDLAQGRRSWTLLFGLVVSFLSSWYISYMTGIFCVPLSAPLSFLYALPSGRDLHCCSPHGFGCLPPSPCCPESLPQTRVPSPLASTGPLQRCCTSSLSPAHMIR